MRDFIAIPDTAQELVNASIHGIDSLLEKVSNRLSLPAIITDPLYQVLSSSGPPFEIGESIFSVSEVETYPEYNTIIYKLTTATTEKLALASIITNNNTTLGYLFIVGQEEDSPELTNYHQLVAFAASLCAVQLQKQQEILKEKVKFKDAFLFDLLYGNLKQKSDILEYGKIWEWNFNIPHQVLVFALPDFNPFSTDKQTLLSLVRIIEKSLIDRRKIPITMIRQNQIILLYSLEDENISETKADIINFANSIFRHMETHDEEVLIACGIGKVYKNPTQLFRSFQEAKVAYDLGLLLDIKIPFFSELGLERILYKHDLQDLREYYNHTLGKLEQYEADNDSNLLETLEAFVSNQFDITKTAKALFLHRNTLRYRLKRIEEILNLKLDDFSIKLDITAAFKIKQLRNL